MTGTMIVRNGMVLDGTGKSAEKADILIQDDKIKAIGRLDDAIADTIIDAAGQTVCPGFIDAHSHAEFIICSKDHQNLMEPYVRQGITTMVTGNCGISAAPINPDYADQLAVYWDCLLPRDGLEFSWQTMGEFLGQTQSIPPYLNMAQMVGHSTVRMNVMGFAQRKPTSEEMKAIRNMVRRSLAEGARGLSYGGAYIPGMWADTDEFVEAARDLPEFNGAISVHLRNQTMFIEESVREMIHVAETVGAHLQLSHFAPYDVAYVDQFFRAMDAIEQARNKGLSIGYDMLTPPIGSTTILIMFPPWMFDGGIPKFLERLSDTSVRRDLMDAFNNDAPRWPFWETNTFSDNRFHLAGGDADDGWSKIRLNGFRKPENQKYMLASVREIAEDQGKDPYDALFDIIIAEGGRLYHTNGDYDVEALDKEAGVLYGLPHMSFMTDTVGLGHNVRHPGIRGVFPRFIGRHGREWGVFPVEEAVRKATSLPADQYNIRDRGQIRPGYFADLIIFDPDTIIDRSTFDEPFNNPDGISTVIVNGSLMLKDGQFYAGNASGRVLRN
jgi:N-acyl-D-amino-acid deacylase